LKDQWLMPKETCLIFDTINSHKHSSDVDRNPHHRSQTNA
jgi:hypothetical protein